jgi:hypothetical protein
MEGRRATAPSPEVGLRAQSRISGLRTTSRNAIGIGVACVRSMGMARKGHPDLTPKPLVDGHPDVIERFMLASLVRWGYRPTTVVLSG